MKSWKHFPHLAGLRSWWLWGCASSAFELWETTKGAGTMADTVQPQDWITWAFAVARGKFEIFWIHPSSIPRWTKWGAPSQIAFHLRRRRSVCVLVHLLQCLTTSRLWGMWAKSYSSSTAKDYSSIPRDALITYWYNLHKTLHECPQNACLGVQVPFCQKEGSRMCGWRWGVIAVLVPWKAECRWELTRKGSVSTSTVHNWEVEVEQRIVNYIPWCSGV